jgi:hypothetical protein
MLSKRTLLMSALFILLLRFLVIFFVIKFVWRLIAGPRQPGAAGRGGTGPRRFDSHGEQVEDADFEEVKNP